MKIKHLKGWITSRNIVVDEWMTEWSKSVSEAERKNCELVVFEIPKNSNLISAIENFLQGNINK